jgi:hypothetical protein
MKRTTRVKLDFKTLVFVAWVICILIEQSDEVEQAAANKLFREHVAYSWCEAGGQVVWRLKVRGDSVSDGGINSNWEWKPDGYKFQRQVGVQT